MTFGETGLPTEDFVFLCRHFQSWPMLEFCYWHNWKVWARRDVAETDGIMFLNFEAMTPPPLQPRYETYTYDMVNVGSSSMFFTSLADMLPASDKQEDEE